MDKQVEYKDMGEVFSNVLKNEYENHIYPFFWLREGEFDKISSALKDIYDCGIRGICVEGRPYESFADDSWWNDLEFILGECSRYGMKVWILDDKKFPTGYAADYIAKHGRRGKKQSVFSHFADVVGPVNDGALLIKYYKVDPDDEIIGIYACKREENSNLLTGEVIDITDGINGDFVYFNLPEGGYKIAVIIKTTAGYSAEEKQRIDFISPEAAELMVEAVYMPHYEKFKKYFGNTLEGFFSDEPNFGNRGYTHKFRVELGEYYAYYPWSDELFAMLKSSIGDDAGSMLPFLWNSGSNHAEAKIRTAYMDAVTRLYEKNFSLALGNWCRKHGVLYTGHVIEDNGIHTQTGKGAGHYFRAMAGQDIPGVDVVLHQIVPGHAQFPTTGEVSYWICDNMFFHYTLAKLASSCAHIMPRSRGRAMCEVFGAYGWAEGIKTMKWLTDFMLVRGINTFVPHAFSMQFPDSDCPPHFSACGNNPEFGDFKVLMAYMNRMSEILGSTKHTADIAVMYHAEAQWSGARFMPVDRVAKELYDNQIDFDIVPYDALESSHIESDGGAFLQVGNARYKCVVVPFSECLPHKIVSKLSDLSVGGIRVVYINGFPQWDSSGTAYKNEIAENDMLTAVDIEELIGCVKKNGLQTVSCSAVQGGDKRFLRVYRGKNGGRDLYMFANEDKSHDINTVVQIKDFVGGDYLIYDCDMNTLRRHCSIDGKIPLNISTYQSVIAVLGADDIAAQRMADMVCIGDTELKNRFTLSLSTVKDYPHFEYRQVLECLKNVTGKDMFPEFSGYMKYETIFDTDKTDGCEYKLDLGFVGESARVFVNGEAVGERISPPYVFDITHAVHSGENTLEIIVANHLGYSQKDRFSRFLMFEPSGVLGPVKIKIFGNC